MTHMLICIDFGDALFTYLKSNFIITDHMARPLTVIGCFSRLRYCGQSVVLTRVPLPSLYTAAISNQEKRSNGRSQSVVINEVGSKARQLGCGLPQGSLVGPFCFPHYCLHIGQIAHNHGINVHLISMQMTRNCILSFIQMRVQLL